MRYVEEQLNRHVPKKYLAALALVVTNIIWGASSPIFKWSLQDIGPFTLAFLRFFLAAAIMLPFVVHKLKVSRKNLLQLLLLATVGFTLHISLFLLGLQRTSSINVPVIGSSAPILIILASVIVLREKIKQKIFVGTIISLIGVLIIMLRPYLDNGLDGTFVGNLFILLSMVGFVIYTILLKELKLPYSTSTITFWLFALAAVTFFPLFFMETFPSLLIPALTVKAGFGILFGAVFTSVLAYYCYNYAIQHMHVNETGVFSYIGPIVAVLTAVPLLGEIVTVSYLMGASLVFLGIIIAESKLHWHPKY